MMKLIKIISLALFLLSSGVNMAVAAPDLGTGQGSLTEKIAGRSGYNLSTNEYSLSETVGRVIKIVLSFVATIFFALTVYAGFLWMTAQGNDDQVEKATGIIRTAVIGMIVVLAAYSITAFAMIFSAQTASPGSEVGGEAQGTASGVAGCCQLNRSVDSCQNVASKDACSGGLFYAGESCNINTQRCQ